MKFELPRPCANCPFRSDKPFHLHPQRAHEIMSGDHTFACHKTVDYDAISSTDDDDGESKYVHRRSDNEQHCAGLLILREKMSRPTQMMRIAERLGFYDPTKLDMNSPVFENIDEAMSSFTKLDNDGRKGRAR